MIIMVNRIKIRHPFLIHRICWLECCCIYTRYFYTQVAPKEFLDKKRKYEFIIAFSLDLG